MTNNIVKYWIPLYLYAGLIFYVSGISRPLPGVSIPFLDKFLHICEYAVFGILAAKAFKNSSRKTFFENFKAFAVVGSVVYGISDEFHQSFIPLRQFSVLDMIADGIGGTIGVVLYGKYNPV